MSRYCFGVDIGGTTIKCGLFTDKGNLIEKWEIITRRENKGEKVPNDVAETVALKMKEHNISKTDVLGIGMGVPGPVKDDGTVLKCANLGWDVINICDIMKNLTGLNVMAANDANVAALGEKWKGGGCGYDDIIVVTLGTGVGGGVILNGKILSGSNGAGGEFGHMIVNHDEKALCGCGGHGHLEQYASATGIVRMAIKALGNSKEDSTLRGLEKITAKSVFDHAKAGDALALGLVDDLGRYLGTALSHVAAVVDPQVFVIGGGVSKAGNILIDVISKHYNRNILNALYGKEFKLAKLGNDAGIYGCAKLICSYIESP